MKLAVIISAIALFASPAVAQKVDDRPNKVTTVKPGNTGTTVSRDTGLKPFEAPKPKRLRVGPVERTNQVSGEARADFNQARARGSVVALLNRFYMKEKSDNPCELNVYQTSWAHDETTGSATVYRFMDQPELPLYWAMWAGCNRDDDEPGYAGAGGKTEIILDEGDYITDLRICTNNRNNDRGRLVKGIEVKTARIKSNGRLQASKSYSDGQPNCKQWKNWSSCPNRALASSIIIHYGFGIEGGMRSIVGLELECMEVRYTDDYPVQ